MAAGQVDVLVGAADPEPRRHRGAGGRGAVMSPSPAASCASAPSCSTWTGIDGRHARRRAAARRSWNGTPSSPRRALRTHPPHQRPLPRPAREGRTRSRTLFAAAELLHAKAVVVLDPDVTSMTPDWVARLVAARLGDGFDFVAPATRATRRRPARHPGRAAAVPRRLRHRLQEPLSSEFGCSGRFASHCLAEDVWSSAFLQLRHRHLAALPTALAGGFRCGEAVLGPALQAPRPAAGPARAVPAGRGDALHVPGDAPVVLAPPRGV